MKKVTDEFVKGKNSIGFVSDSFISEFGNEELSEGKILSFKKLPRTMNDSEIIRELKVEECTLSDVLETLKNPSADLKDGYSNIFYIKDHSRVVDVYWDDGESAVFGWLRGGSWRVGFRVFTPATGAQFPSSIPSDSWNLISKTYKHSSGIMAEIIGDKIHIKNKDNSHILKNSSKEEIKKIAKAMLNISEL